MAYSIKQNGHYSNEIIGQQQTNKETEIKKTGFVDA